MTSHKLLEPEETEVWYGPGLRSDSYELWTRNSVYFLDENLRCVAVKSLDREARTGTRKILGAALTGSREGWQFWESLPAPGARAIFTTARHRVAVTSTVLRLVKKMARRR